jgi:hypothetical protein
VGALPIEIVTLAGRGKIHPWLHLDDQGVVVGRVTDAGKIQLVTSARTTHQAESGAVKELLAFSPRVYSDLRHRWPDQAVDEWVRAQTGAPASFSEALSLAIHELERLVEFVRPQQAALLATWAVATYFHRCFLAFPRLQLVGERGCGKSKVLTILQQLSWNASLLLTPTPAVLFRIIQETRPTLLLDECEALDRDDRRELLAIINSGYKPGGNVPRCEGERKKVVEFYDVFSPLAIAGIRGLNPTTEDRAIPVVMQRGTDRTRLNTEINTAAPGFSRVRAACYRLLLERHADVRLAYETWSPPRWLNARALELWRPLIALASVADTENGLTLAPDLLALAREHVEDRDEVSPEGEALLAELSERLAEADLVILRPADLAEPCRRRLGWQSLSPEQVGTWLRRFGFRRKGKGRGGAKYEIRADRLREVTVRFGGENTVTPSPSPVNATDSLTV